MSELKNGLFPHPVIKATVGAIITKINAGEKEILLTRQGFPPYQDHWCLPGGHIDKDETARQAIIREVKEEVGLDFEPQFLFYWDEIIPAMDIHAVVLVFSGPVNGFLQAQLGEVLEMAWFTFDQIENTSLAFQHNSIISRFRREFLGKTEKNHS